MAKIYKTKRMRYSEIYETFIKNKSNIDLFLVESKKLKAKKKELKNEIKNLENDLLPKEEIISDQIDNLMADTKTAEEQRLTSDYETQKNIELQKIDDLEKDLESTKSELVDVNNELMSIRNYENILSYFDDRPMLLDTLLDKTDYLYPVLKVIGFVLFGIPAFIIGMIGYMIKEILLNLDFENSKFLSFAGLAFSGLSIYLLYKLGVFLFSLFPVFLRGGVQVLLVILGLLIAIMVIPILFKIPKAYKEYQKNQSKLETLEARENELDELIPEKNNLIDLAEKKIDNITQQYQEQMLSLDRKIEKDVREGQLKSQINDIYEVVDLMEKEYESHQKNKEENIKQELSTVIADQEKVKEKLEDERKNLSPILEKGEMIKKEFGHFETEEKTNEYTLDHSLVLNFTSKKGELDKMHELTHDFNPLVILYSEKDIQEHGEDLFKEKTTIFLNHLVDYAISNNHFKIFNQHLFDFKYSGINFENHELYKINKLRVYRSDSEANEFINEITDRKSGVNDIRTENIEQYRRLDTPVEYDILYMFSYGNMLKNTRLQQLFKNNKEKGIIPILFFSMEELEDMFSKRTVDKDLRILLEEANKDERVYFYDFPNKKMNGLYCEKHDITSIVDHVFI